MKNALASNSGLDWHLEFLSNSECIGRVLSLDTPSLGLSLLQVSQCVLSVSFYLFVCVDAAL